MSNIYKAFENKKAFIPFVTGGDPDLETTKNLLIAMEKAGADLIEIGIPFSDPIAEGPVIQEASQRALAAGCTTDKLFDMVKEARQRVKIPMVFMTYINPVYTYGKERFMKRCVECGIDGIIVPDLPYEEKEELSGVCESYGIDLISLIAPTSHERISMIAKEASGFVYCVSQMGVTGKGANFHKDIREYLAAVKQTSAIPVMVGFGIRTAKDIEPFEDIVDGAIVGSNLLRILEESNYSVDAVKEYVSRFKKELNENK